jgi:F-type H+-transporting ATPase subunit a
MTTLFEVLREAGRRGEETLAQGGELAGLALEEPQASGGPDIGEMLMHHLVDEPYVELPGFIWALPQWAPIQIGGLSIDLSPTKHVFFLLLAAVLVTPLMISVARTMARQERERAPKGLANALEAIILYFRDEIVRRNIGHGADGYTPFILTLFFFILTLNLLGLVPFGSAATGNLSVTAGLAFVSLMVIEVSGFRTLGPKGYAKTIFYAPKGLGPVGQGLMLIIMTPVEALGKIAKPFALAMRLFANMTAGHTVMLSLVGLIFVFGHLPIGRWGIAAGAVGMSMFLMILKIFVCALQAYIFSMLTSVFIGLIRHSH